MSKKFSLPRVVFAASLAFAAPVLAKQAPSNPSGDTGKIGATPVPTGPTPVPDSPIGDKSTPSPPILPDITAYVLMDAQTGAVLAEADPHLEVPPASLTKLMTAHIVYQAIQHGSLKLTQTVPVSVNAWHQQGSTMFIDPNSVVTVDQLLHGLIIDSGNDAAVALAEQVAGSTAAFVQMMNRSAAKIGLTDTNYTNVTGLPDPDLHTSAFDVALLSRAILNDEPEILQISKQKSYTYDNITQRSWNPVLFSDSTVDGLKTGLTRESGHCIDATAKRGDMRLIAVVTGGPTWAISTAAVESLLDYGQHFFTDLQISQVGQQVGVVKSNALDSGQVDVGVTKSVTVTLPVDAQKFITHTMTVTAPLTQGVHKGEILGSVTYSAKGETLADIPIAALADSPKASLTTKLSRKIRSLL